MPSLDLKSFIRNVPDFPQPGVLFLDITPLVQEQEAYGDAEDAVG